VLQPYFVRLEFRTHSSSSITYMRYWVQLSLLYSFVHTVLT